MVCLDPVLQHGYTYCEFVTFGEKLQLTESHLDLKKISFSKHNSFISVESLRSLKLIVEIRMVLLSRVQLW